MAQRRLRIGLVGANGGSDRWGARGHIPAIQSLEEAELVAVCTSREETARKAQQRTGAPLAFWDYEDLVACPDVDLVSVSVRISLHHPVTMAALEAGKHVLCEWPLALDSGQGMEMYNLARGRGLRHAVGTQARYSPGVMYARELIQQGYIGSPRLFSMTHFLSRLRQFVAHRWWLAREDEGGGARLIACGHALDTARWLLGNVEAVCGVTDTLVKEASFADTGETVPITAPDALAFLTRLTSGVVGTVHISTACPEGSGFRLEVYGSEGRLQVETPGMVQYSPARVYGARSGEPFQELPVPARFTQVTTIDPSTQPFQLAQLLRRFIRSIQDEEEFQPGFQDGVKLLQAIKAIDRSSRTGRWERVGEDRAG